MVRMLGDVCTNSRTDGDGFVRFLPCCYDMAVVHWTAMKHNLWPRSEYFLYDDPRFPLLAVGD